MSKKSSFVTLVVVILITAALVFGGGRWLWHLFLKMHGSSEPCTLNLARANSLTKGTIEEIRPRHCFQIV